MSNIVVVFSNKKNGWLQLQVFLLDRTVNGAIKLVTNITSTPYNEKGNPYNLTPQEIQIVRSVYFSTDNCIAKKLPKGFVVDDIYADISKPDKDKNPLLKQLFAQIFDNNKKSVKLLKNGGDIPIFFNFSNITSLFDEDSVVMELEKCVPVYEITIDSSTISYRIALFHKDKEIDIQFKNRFINFLPTNPTSFIVNKRFYTLEGANYRQIAPFTQKSTTISMPSSVLNNETNFVVKTIKEAKVIAKGFNIVSEEVVPNTRLHIITDLSHLPHLSVEFEYGKHKVEPGAIDKVFVSKDINASGEITFCKIDRNLEFETQKLELLTELGLVDSLSNFSNHLCNLAPSAALDNSDPKSRLYDLLAWANENADSLLMHDFILDFNYENRSYYGGNYEFSQFALEEKLDWFDLSAIIQIGEFKYPFTRFKNHILNNNPEFELVDGKIFILPKEWFTKFYDFFNLAQVTNDSIQLNKGLHHLAKQAFTTFTPDFSEGINLKHFDLNKVNEPLGLNGTLRSYQKYGFQWMNNLQKYKLGGILADDMGLGKTIQVISLILKSFEGVETKGAQAEATNHLSLFGGEIATTGAFNRSEVSPTLIVMPTSLLHNWMSEIKKFAPSLKTYLYQDKNRLKENDLHLLMNYHVVLVSYGILQNDIDILNKFHFNYVVLDESQYIKNPTSKRYRSVTQLVSNFRLAMSGTPIENSLSDLWAQMNFVNPGLLKSLQNFKARYINPIEKSVNQDSQAEEDKLFYIIDPFILRRTKDMVAKELPPITIQTHYCDMSEEQRSYYEKARSAIRREYLEHKGKLGYNKSTAHALKAITRLRQIANHPRLIDSEYTDSSGKFEEVMVALETVMEENHNVLIFSQFARNIAVFEAEVKRRGWSYAKLTGATSNREEEINKFVNNEGCRIFFITTKSGGTGLNLVKADYVFMLDPWWNEAAENQAFNRAHRIGQDKSVFVYRFISVDTIEQKMATLQAKKSSTANKFIRPQEHFGTITEVDMEELLS